MNLLGERKKRRLQLRKPALIGALTPQCSVSVPLRKALKDRPSVLWLNIQTTSSTVRLDGRMRQRRGKII